MTDLEKLFSRRRFGMKPGLGRMREILGILALQGNLPQTVHIAGTNGKGATAAMLDSLARHSRTGHSVLRYTSPHLVSINERFFFNGKPVCDDMLERAVGPVIKASENAATDLTFFEALTAVAFVLARDISPDLAILECGLGGRFDATNVCTPSLCVITKIGLDHCAWLGDSLESVAQEKGGIIKKGVPVVVGENPPETVEILRRIAERNDAPFFTASQIASEEELPPETTPPGRFNRENAVTALAAARLLGLELDGESVRKALTSVVWPGRFQRVGDVIIDGAHNPQAAMALRSELLGNRRTLIAGFCSDKDVEGVLSILSPVVSAAFSVKTSSERSLESVDTAYLMKKAGMHPVTACDSFNEALSRARALGNEILVAGSLYLAGEALMELGAYPWGRPEFSPGDLLAKAD